MSNWRRPGKPNRDSAYPAVAEMNTPMIIVNAATSTELSIHRGKFVSVSTYW